MRIVFMGTPDFAVVELERLVDAGHEVLAVYCQPDKPKGRSRTPAPPPVKVCADHHHLMIRQPRRLGKRSCADLTELNPDLIVVSAYGKLLPPAILELPRYGCVNVHASMLPKYRGAAPIQWAIANGESVTGVSLMQMNEGLDTGDVLASAEVLIDSEDTAETLHDKLADTGGTLLIESLPKLEKGELTPIPQDDALATHASILSREDGAIDWQWSSGKIRNRIRGFHPWPGTHTCFRGKVLKLFPFAECVDTDESAPLGTVLDISSAGVVVRCGKGALRLTRVQLAGKRRLTAFDFANGAHLEVGERFGDA